MEDDMATEAAYELAEQPLVERYETIVIGGGQAGLSVGYYLKKHGRSFLILDANERIGGSWRTRTWSSLRLFTPARYDGLAGWPFPAPGWSFPTARETADYLEAYADRFQLPVETATRVERLTRDANLPYFFSVGNHDVTGMPPGDPGRALGLHNTLTAMSRLMPSRARVPLA